MMREPKLKDLMIDEAGTARLRASAIPYHALVSRVLKTDPAKQTATESRLDQLEREVKRIKRIRVA